ncbi:MAG TPA: hypothetical protein VIK81_04690 [Patescibacteria group bacterium]
MTQESFREKLSLTEPPLNWYRGFGRKEVGVTIVIYDDRLINLGGEELCRHLTQWNHYTGNPVSRRDSIERKRRVAEEIKAAEDYVFKLTGFTPKEIMDKAYQLQEEYKGKDTAPFLVELY